MARFDHTIKDTGITVRIRKVSPLLMLELDRRFPRPTPPMNKVVFDGRETWEENPADPDYHKQLAKYEQEHEVRLRRLLIRRGVDYTLTPDNFAEVKELRDFWKETYGDELDGSDLEIFISYLALGSPHDLNELTEKILNRIQPTEATVAEATERFPAEVQGARFDGNSSPDVRRELRPKARMETSG